MVAMDPDTEFNALSTLYQSVVADMKSSYPAWEVVGQRAVKLAAALKAAVSALAAFTDSVQSVSDLASNLKGASRDVGACVTRICMRQRAVEGRLKSLGDALSEELAVGVHARTAFWRARTAEMDKAAAKHAKKVRARKGRPDETVMSTQRALCKQLLAEQRAQFAFFLSQLQPVLSAEVALLDEASHIRPSIEALEATAKHVDGDLLVETILADLTQGASAAWKTCLTTAAGAASFSLSSSTTTTSSEGDADGRSSRMTSPSMAGGDRGAGGGGGGGGVYADSSYAPSLVDVDLTPQQQQHYHHHHHEQPIQHIYASLPHTPSVFATGSGHGGGNNHITSTPSLPRPGHLPPPAVPINGPMGMNSVHRATLGRRLSSTSVPPGVIPPPTPSSLSTSPSDNYAVSSFRGSASELRLSRPHSYFGGGGTLQQGASAAAAAAATAAGCNYAATPLHTPARVGGGELYGASTSSFSYGGSSSSSSVSASHPASAAAAAATSSLIAETVQAIEGLGSDLEQYCTPRVPDGASTMRRGEYASTDVCMRNNNQQHHNDGAVRVRPESTARPLPPSRRSSAITSATPSAPSVADARMSMVSGHSGGALRSSRQSLISDGGEAPPTPQSVAPYSLIDTTPVSFRQGPGSGYGRPY